MVSEKSKANLKKGNPETQFKPGRAQVEIAKKGAKRAAEVRKAKKEALDVFGGAVANTSQEDLMKAFKAIQKYAKDGSLPHWQEWLRLIGQSESAVTEVKVSFDGDLKELAQ